MYSKNEGNIHSGAPPPWLLSSNEDTSSNEIGPTMDTYKAHCKSLSLSLSLIESH